MSYKSVLVRAGIAALLGVLGGGAAISATQDKYTVEVPEGLAVSEFKGYESWEVIVVSHNGDLLAAIMGKPVMIEAFKSGIPGNGEAFPDGAKMAKFHRNAQKAESEPGQPAVQGAQHFFSLNCNEKKS